MDYKIKENVMADAKLAALNTYPDEFMCFLGSTKNNNILDEIIVFPTYSSKTMASINLNDIPFGSGVVGSLHSHPSNNINPSKADLKFFRLYEINIIVGSIYPQNFKIYNRNGEEITLEFI